MTGNNRDSAVNRRSLGSRYEELAADFLEKNGLRILRRNYRCKCGEVDIIAMDGNVLVFAEVKYRKTGRYGSSLEAVDMRKRKTISRVSRWYLTACAGSLEIPCRFDVIGIEGERIRWVKDAFPYCGPA